MNAYFVFVLYITVFIQCLRTNFYEFFPNILQLTFLKNYPYINTVYIIIGIILVNIYGNVDG